MRKAVKSRVIATMLLVAILVNTSTVSASETFNQNVLLSTSWKTIAKSTTGFDCNVAISCLVTGTDGLGAVRPDIRMLGRSGNVLWSESKSCPGLGTRIYKCGPDVYEIQIRVSNGSGTARSYKTTQDPN